MQNRWIGIGTILFLVFVTMGPTGCLGEDKILDNNSFTQHPDVDAGSTNDMNIGSDVVDESGQDLDAGYDSALDVSDDFGIDAYLDSDADFDSQPGGCRFRYDEQFAEFKSLDPPSPAEIDPDAFWGGNGFIAHLDPPPPFVYRAVPHDYKDGDDDIIMPGYDDDMPLFERASVWEEETRCYETPFGAALYTETEAYNLYRTIAELTTGIQFDAAPEVRTVLGLRGAYPGTFEWHGNTPNQFNDTIVLMWTDSDGERHVREFPVHTDVGNYDFGLDSSSSLRPNRRYYYTNGTHKSYNALQISEIGYRVRNDTNHNGHWDSDRNGWLPPNAGQDYDRGGSYHNIHMASVDDPLGEANVNNWSAGCQVIPGMDNWTEFIRNAWTGETDPVNYFLVDVRDIAPEVWEPCTEDGSHQCPYRIEGTSFTHTANTATDGADDFDIYNCSGADESGPEVVYVMTIDQTGDLTVSVDCDDPEVDVDVHLLDGDDQNACLDRDHWALMYDITPGRYWVIVDTFVDGDAELSGDYTLTVTMD